MRRWRCRVRNMLELRCLCGSVAVGTAGIIRPSNRKPNVLDDCQHWTVAGMPLNVLSDIEFLRDRTHRLFRKLALTKSQQYAGARREEKAPIAIFVLWVYGLWICSLGLGLRFYLFFGLRV